jgi:hypothetical protein
MANGLMEFAEGFALTFGEGMAENIRKRGAEEDKYVRDQVALMRQRIANGKAKESQLKNEVRQRIELLQGQLKGFSDEDIKAAASNEFRFQEIQNLIQTDKGYGDHEQDKVGKWYMSGKVDPYKPREDQVRTPGATLLSEIFVPVKLDPEKPVEEDNILRTLFGAPTDPAKLQRMAEDRVVSQRGMGALDSTGAADLERYYARGGTVRQPTAPGTGNIGRPLPKSAAPKTGSVSNTEVQSNVLFGQEIANLAFAQSLPGDTPDELEPGKTAPKKRDTLIELDQYYKEETGGKPLPKDFPKRINTFRNPIVLRKIFSQMSRNESLNKDSLAGINGPDGKPLQNDPLFKAFLRTVYTARNRPSKYPELAERDRQITGRLGVSPTNRAKIGEVQQQ